MSLSPAHDAPLLKVEGLAVDLARKGGVTRLVEDVSFEVMAGQTLCIVGESGCGKSLTALALMGLLATPPLAIAAGDMHFKGAPLDAAARARLRGDRMTMIFQEPMSSLNPAFTLGDQIGEAVRRHHDVGEAEALARARAMLERVRIPAAQKRLGDYPHQLSGGMRQRVMIAMALVNRPDLLIADEPTTALDVTIQAQVLALISELQRDIGTAMVLITHDLGVVAQSADHVAVMYAGRIVERAPVAALFADPQHPYTLGLMGSLPSLGKRTGKLVTIPGSVPAPDAMPQGCRFSTRCPFADAQCRAETPPLATLGSGHWVACWKAPLEAHAPRELAAAT